MTTDDRADAQARVLAAVERLGRLTREIGQSIARDHAGTRATVAIARLLDTVGEAGVGDVAQALRVDVSVASRQVSELVADGLVERTVADGDRRARNLRLTPAGRAYADGLRAAMCRLADEAFADWTGDELRAAAGVVDRLVETVARGVGCRPDVFTPGPRAAAAAARATTATASPPARERASAVTG